MDRYREWLLILCVMLTASSAVLTVAMIGAMALIELRYQ